MATTTGRIVRGLILGSLAWASSYAEDRYLGVLNANASYINSISNTSGTKTGDFSTASIFAPEENAQWVTHGPVVVAVDGQVLGTLSSLETDTHSLFNETIAVQVPYTYLCETCTHSYNNQFSTSGPKIYNSQSEEYEDKIGSLIGNEIGADNERH
jgi:hypothetical protein